MFGAPAQKQYFDHLANHEIIFQSPALQNPLVPTKHGKKQKSSHVRKSSTKIVVPNWQQLNPTIDAYSQNLPAIRVNPSQRNMGGKHELSQD